MASRLSQRQQAKIAQRQKQTISQQQQAQQAQQIKTKVQQTKENLDKLRGELLAAERQRDLAFQAVNRSGLFGRARRNSLEFKRFLQAEAKVKKLRPQFDAAKRSFAVAREQEDISKRGFSRVGFGKKPKPKTTTTAQPNNLVQTSITILQEGKPKRIIGFKDSQGNFTTTRVSDAKAVNKFKKETGATNAEDLAELTKSIRRQVTANRRIQLQNRRQNALIDAANTNLNGRELTERGFSGSEIIQILALRTQNIAASPQQQEQINATLEPGKKPGFLSSLTTPSKADSKTVSFLKSAGRDVIDTVVGVKIIASTLNTAINPLTSATEQERVKAREDIMKIFSKNTFNAIGASIGADLESNDPYRKTRGLVSIIPVIGIPSLTSKTLRVLNSVTKYEVSAGSSGSTKFKIDTQGITTGNQKFRQRGNLRLLPSGNIVGTIISTVGGRGKRITVNLKDQGAFYIDKKNKIRIPKSNVPVKDFYFTSKQTAIKFKGTPKERVDFKGNVIKLQKGKYTIRNKKIVFKEGVRTDVTKVRSGKFDSARSAVKGKLLDLKTFNRGLSAIGKSKKQYTKADMKDAEKAIKILESIDYDKKILNGVDRRTRLGVVLGLKKSQALVKKIEPLFKDGYLIITKQKARVTGSFETINPQKYYLGPAVFLKSTPSIKKKASRNKNGTLKLPQKINIPNLSAKIYLPTKKALKAKIPAFLYRKAVAQGFIQDRKVKQTPAQQQKPIRKQVPLKKQTPIKIQKKIQTPKKKTPSKTRTKKKRTPIPKRPKVPKIPIRKIPKPPKVPILRISTKYRKSKTLRTGYQIIIKEGNRIVAQSTTLLPLNRAKNVLRQRLDNTPQASGNIKPIGKTNIIDVKPKKNNKFRIKRSKGTKVLRVVEKKKFRLDTPGEKKGLKAAKKRKVKKKSKPKTNPAARKVFKTKKAAQLKGYSVYKVKGGWKRRKL